jgi:hypothetical protein
MHASSHRSARLVLVALLTMTLLVWQWFEGLGVAQDDRHFFPETQHYVESPFYEFFTAHGGVSIFGYPITEQHLIDPDTGRTVQYFQRARMDFTPGAGVTLAKLAEEMGYATPRLAPDKIPPETPFTRYFPVTGHSSSYAFLAFWDQRGGEEVFGYPITEPVKRNGRLVQYFERARMEWWPEREPSLRVDLTQLGVLYASQYVDATWLPPITDNASIVTPTPVVLSLEVLASVKEPVTRQSGRQTVYVVVGDQTGKPVKGATVQITVNSSLSTHSYPGVQTSGEGLADVTFDVEPDLPSKTVTIDVVVTYGNVTARTQTSYMVWWGAQ